MNNRQPEDWDSEIPCDIRDRILAVQTTGGPAPVVVVVSSAFLGGLELLADLGYRDVQAGDPAPLAVVAADRLRALLDRRMGAGVGRIVTSARLTVRGRPSGVLVLPETIEVHAMPLDPTEQSAGPACIVDLAGHRLHVSEDQGVTGAPPT